MISRVVFLFSIIFCLQSCQAITIDPVEAAELVGSCQQLVQSSYLVKTSRNSKAGFVSERLIITESYYKNYTNRIIGRLETNTKFKVRHIVKDVNLTESCWLVEVEILDGKFEGLISQLPSCSMQPPTWLNSIGPQSRLEGGLKIKSEYATACKVE